MNKHLRWPSLNLSNNIIEFYYMELLVTNSCNLHCDGCANYSNYNLKETIDADDYAEIIRLWSTKVRPTIFRLLGGEPLAHPKLSKLILAAAAAWPDSTRVVVTNGLLLARRPDLPVVLRQTNTRLELSVHSNDPEYIEMLKPALTVLKKWRSEEGVQVSWSDCRKFYRLYRGIGKTMLPYEDNDPQSSYENCGAKTCITMYRGRLWKCPKVAYLRSALRKFDLENSPPWQPYLNYEGVGLDASHKQLETFLSRKAEDVCKMCPKSPNYYYKDVFNTNFERNEEFLDVDYPIVDLEELFENA